MEQLRNKFEAFIIENFHDNTATKEVFSLNKNFNGTYVSSYTGAAWSGFIEGVLVERGQIDLRKNSCKS